MTPSCGIALEVLSSEYDTDTPDSGLGLQAKVVEALRVLPRGSEAENFGDHPTQGCIRVKSLRPSYSGMCPSDLYLGR